MPYLPNNKMASSALDAFNRGRSRVGGLGTASMPTQTTGGLNVQDPEVLQALLTQLGGKSVEPKANVLDRIIHALGAFEWTDEALKAAKGGYKGKGGALGAVGEYLLDIPRTLVESVLPGTTKKQTQEGKGKELMEQLGMKGAGAAIGGFIADVLEPTLLIDVVTGGGKTVLTEGAQGLLKTAGKEVAEAGVKAGGKRIAREAVGQVGERVIKELAPTLGQKAAEEVGEGVTEQIIKRLGRSALGQTISPIELRNVLKPILENTPQFISKVIPEGLYFAGKRITKLGKAGKAAKAYFDPLKTLGGVAKKIPGVEKAGLKVGGALEGMFGGIGKLFSTSAPYKQAGATSLGELNKAFKASLGASPIKGAIQATDLTVPLERMAKELGAPPEKIADILGLLVEQKGGLWSAAGEALGGDTQKLATELLQKGSTPVARETLDRIFKNYVGELEPVMDKLLRALNNDETASMIAKRLGIAINKESLPALLQSTLGRGRIDKIATQVLGDAGKMGTADTLSKTMSNVSQLADQVLKPGAVTPKNILEALSAGAAGTAKEAYPKFGSDLFAGAVEPYSPKAVSTLMKQGMIGEAAQPAAFEKAEKLIDEFRVQNPKWFARVDELANTVVQNNATMKPILDDLGIRNVGDAYWRRVYDAMEEAKSKGLRTGQSALQPSALLGQAGKKRKIETLAEALNSGLELKDGTEGIREALIEASAAQNNAKAAHSFYSQLSQLTDDAGEKLLVNADPLTLGTGEYKVFTKIPMLQGKAMKKELTDLIESGYEAAFNPKVTDGLLKAVDQANKVYATMITSLSIPIPGTKVKIPVAPMFYGRNVLNNGLSSMIYGNIDPATYVKRVVQGKDQLQYLAKLMKEGTEAASEMGAKKVGDYTIAEIVGAALDRNLLKTGEQAVLQKSMTGAGMDKALSVLSSGEIGTATEDVAKLGLFTDQLLKGKSADEAAATVRKILFDYSDLTGFERDVMRRMFPVVYTWARKNLELQFNEILKNPRRMAIMTDVFELIKNVLPNILGEELTEEEYASLPPWVQSTLAIAYKDKKGGLHAITGFGTGFEALANVIGENPVETAKNIMGSLNPLARIPIELASDYSFFKGRKISEDYYGSAYEGVDPLLKSLVGYGEREYIDQRTGEKRTRKYVNPQAAYLLNQLAGRPMQMERLISSAGTAKRTVPDVMISGLTGIRGYGFDYEEERRRREEELLRQLELALLQQGIGAQYSNFYIPKSQQAQLAQEYGLMF